MAVSMTSRERIMAALSVEEPDRVPIAMRNMEPMNHLWQDRLERAVILRDRFGIDDFLTVGHAWLYDPTVEEVCEWKTWEEKGYPLLVTDYKTPAGTLHAEVRRAAARVTLAAPAASREDEGRGTDELPHGS